jgi:hypothetical protein
MTLCSSVNRKIYGHTPGARGEQYIRRLHVTDEYIPIYSSLHVTDEYTLIFLGTEEYNHLHSSALCYSIVSSVNLEFIIYFSVI